MSADQEAAGASYRASALEACASALLERAGLARDRAADIASVLVEGDCFGKSTHGLALLPLYLREIESDDMSVVGEPEIVNDFGACLTWDGHKLPGPWLLRRATQEARAARFGMGAIAIQRSHHTACLGAYLRPAVDAGYMMLLTLTDPGHSSVAPFGGVTPVLTSNPMAFGAPATNGPVMVDMSTALLTNGAIAAYRQRGEQLPPPFLMDSQGQPSTDPNIMAVIPPGTVLPLGGLEAGHKGYSLGLIVELLTGCLSGRGRADATDGWSAAVFILVIDLAAFGGADAFRRQVAALAGMCHASQTRQGFERVELPGAHALARREWQLRDGVRLSASIIAEIVECARRFEVPMPDPIP
ncbi:Ldh family oxidoreductase [Bradyrhizobium australafricanum]|uniref:Ldh family oxidoreductase n=1 Tax=Bradyrhizobium australafricanum TaxID=2821406 RepID=UPI001CE28C07|nr:Ldh family oxidoreductase [Bradyrhizobium australafricanum]MCA6105056.1 Ldh family oxidoreductase [Bradyrhizobium australafricanum]